MRRLSSGHTCSVCVKYEVNAGYFVHAINEQGKSPLSADCCHMWGEGRGNDAETMALLMMDGM